MHAEAVNVRTMAPMRLDRHAGASPGEESMPGRYHQIHDTAARQDGIVKVLTGLMLVVVSSGLAAVGVLVMHAFFPNGEFRLWAYLLGIPCLVLTILGLVLFAWGAVKLISGRGAG
jgi:hypothetical protein